MSVPFDEYSFEFLCHVILLRLEISDSEEEVIKRSSLEVDDGGAATMMTC